MVQKLDVTSSLRKTAMFAKHNIFLKDGWSCKEAAKKYKVEIQWKYLWFNI